MRRRISANKQAAGVSLFPFLAVLLCTMGALIVVLVVIARQAHIQVAEAARREAATSANGELAAEGEQLEWRISELKKSREETQKILNDKQAELSHIEEHTRRLRDQLEELEDARVHFSELAAGDSKETEELKKRLARLRIDADRTKREIDDLRRNAGGTGESYAIIPYHGPSETHRRPIYVECRKDSIILQPEGIVLSEYDFTVDLGPSNPLAGALRAAKEYHLRNQLAGKGDGGTPYPLFLVRPDGIMMWYVGRAAIASWGSEFGYELVGADWKFDFPPVEPMLKMSMNQAVEEGRIRQQYLARAAPRMMHSGGGTFRAARGGGLVQVDGAPVGRGGGGRRGFGRPAGVLGRRNGGRDSQNGGSPGGGLVNSSAGPTTEGPIHSIDGDDNPYLSALGPGGGNASRPPTGGSTGVSGGTGLGAAGSGGAGDSTTVLAGGGYPAGGPGSSGWRNGGKAGGSPFSDPTAPALGTGGGGRLPGGGGNGTGTFGSAAGVAGRGNRPSPDQLATSGGQGSGMYPSSTGGMLPGGIGQSGSGMSGNRSGGQGGNGALGNGGSGDGSSGNGQAAGLGNGQGTGPNGGANKGNGLFLGNKGGLVAGQKGSGTLAGSANGVAGGGPAGTGTAANGGAVPGTAANGTPASGTVATGTAYRGQRAGGSRASSNSSSGPGTSDLANADPNSSSGDAGSSIAASPNGYAGATVVDNGQASGDSSAASSRYAGTAGNATSGSLTGVDSGGSPGGNSSRGGTGGNSASPSRAGRSNSYAGNPNTNFSSSQVSSYNNSSSNSSSSSGQQSPFGGSASASSSMSSPTMGGMPSPSMNFGQQAQADEKKPHRRRERNWANPDASTMNVPLERTIRVVCDADHLTLVPEGRGKQAMRIIPFKGPTHESVDELVGAVWDRIESWGTAGRGMYWRPKLQMEIEPGGQRRYTELQALLADSGFDVHGKPRRRILGDRRVGKVGN